MSPKKIGFSARILSLCMLPAISNSVYGIIAPFLPGVLKSRGIDSRMFGYIFSAYSLAFTVWSPIVGILHRYIKIKHIMMAALFMMAISMLGYAYAPSIIEDNNQLMSCLIFLRVIQGMSSTSIHTSVYVAVDLFFPEQSQSVMGLVLSTGSMGITMSPTVGSFLYELKGYEFPFLTFSLFCIFGILLSTLLSEPEDSEV